MPQCLRVRAFLQWKSRKATVSGAALEMRTLTCVAYLLLILTWVSLLIIDITEQPLEFPDPTVVNPRRPPSSYHLNGAGFHNCPGTTYAQLTIMEIVKAVFQLKNVRRAPGNAGRLKRFTEVVHETETDIYLQRNGSTGPWPGSLYLVVCLTILFSIQLQLMEI
jgi:hypothetical protein